MSFFFVIINEGDIMNSKLIICPNNTKMKILEELSKKKELHNNIFL